MIQIKDMPPWLPYYIKSVFYYMDRDEALNARERGFFTDERLKGFWVSVGRYLDEVNPERTPDAASSLVSGFLGGLAFYGHTGTKDRPSPKVNARERQKKADKLIAKAAQLSEQLADTLYQIEQTTHVRPCEMWFMALFRKVVIDVDDSFDRLPSHWEDIYTERVIRELGETFRAYPPTDEQFSTVPGMASRESSWKDWMRSAHASLQMMLRMYPGTFILRESHWVVIAKVLIDENITRDRVHPAFKELNNGII